MLSITVPIIINGLSVWTLWRTWLTQLKHKKVLRIASGVMFLISLYAWIQVFGAEYGTTCWFIVSALIALAIIGVTPEEQRKVNQNGRQNTLLKSQKNTAEKPRANHLIPWRRILKSSATFFISFVLTLITSMSVCLALAKWLPGTQANVLVGMAFLFPVLWSLLCSWVLSSSRRLKPITVMSLILVVALTGVVI